MMGGLETFWTIILGAVGSILAVLIIALYSPIKSILNQTIRLPLRLSYTLVRGGISRITLSRSDYGRYRVGGGTLRDYLATANESIDIISISMNVTQAEGALIALFKSKIDGNSRFVFRITLLNPNSPAVELVAKSLDIDPSELRLEIHSMLASLSRAKLELSHSCAQRFQIFVHDTIPIGSAILLDATEKSGRIQIETKLYRAPRIESFGLEVVGPSEFYSRNYTSWLKVFNDSTSWEMNDLPLLRH
jgi:hypothetical protein